MKVIKKKSVDYSYLVISFFFNVIKYYQKIYITVNVLKKAKGFEPSTFYRASFQN